MKVKGLVKNHEQDTAIYEKADGSSCSGVGMHAPRDIAPTDMGTLGNRMR